MHAVVTTVSISDLAPALDELREQVVPRVSAQPGFVTGHWTRAGNTGVSMTIWESEENANAAAGIAREVAPEGVTIDSVDVREVVASA